MLWLYFVITTSTYLQHLTYLHLSTNLHLCTCAAKDSSLLQCYIILLIEIDTCQHVIVINNTRFYTYVFHKIYTVSKNNNNSNSNESTSN